MRELLPQDAVRRLEHFRQQQGYDARTEGNKNPNGVDREAARSGTARTPDDIPKQDTIKYQESHHVGGAAKLDARGHPR